MATSSGALSGLLLDGNRHASSCTDKVENFFSSKWVIGVGIITTLAIAVLGGLALAGIFYPTSPLGVLAGTFGQIGTFVTLGVGAALFAAILIALVVRHCCAKNAKQSQGHTRRRNDAIEKKGTPDPTKKKDGEGSSTKTGGEDPLFKDKKEKGGGNPFNPNSSKARFDLNTLFE